MTTDILHRRIPNVSVMLMLIAAITSGFLISPMNWKWQIIAALLSFGLLFLIRETGNFLLKQDTMGMGDIKLAGALGAWLGFSGFLLCLFLGSTLAVGSVFLLRIIGKDIHGKHIPLGFYLGLAALIIIGLHLLNPTLFQLAGIIDPLAWLSE